MSQVQVTQVNIPPGMIDLGVGQPGPGLLPLDVMREATARRIAEPDPLGWLAYGAEQGNGHFRAALARFLTDGYGLPVSADDLFVTGGASQGLDLVCSLFTRPGDTILVEEPTYFLALRIFADHGLTTASVPMDRDGIVVDALAEKLAEHRPALLYTIPAFHNPTSVTLAESRREQLVELALRHEVPIVADEVYQLLGYTSSPPRPLAAWAGTDAVLSLGSFSKILAPGLRLGWIQTGPRWIDRLVRSGLLDSGGGLNPFTSAMVQSALELGLADQHRSALRRAYLARSAALGAALREHLGDTVAFDPPGGGFFLWLRLPDGIDARELLPIAREHGVAFQPGPAFSRSGGSRCHARLSFAYYDREDLEAGAIRLARALERLRA